MTDDVVRFETRMSDADALLWRLERDPLLRSTITSVSVFDRPFDRERLVERIDRGTRLIPRLRQRVLTSPLSPSPPRWVVDPGFDLRYHLRWLRAPGEGTMRDLLDLVEPLAMQGFDRARPLWEFTVVDGLEGGRCAFIQKIHHSITDGVGGIRLAMLLLDLEEAPAAAPEPMPPAPPPEHLRLGERFVDAAGHEQRRTLGIALRQLSAARGFVSDPVGATRRGIDSVASVARLLAPEFTPLSPLLSERSTGTRFDTVVVPLGELKAAARASGGKLNDAFVAGVATGLGRYHERLGVTVERLRMTMPINVRTDETESVAGNQIVPSRFLVPVTAGDPLERMRTVHELVEVQRNEPAGRYAELIAGILNRLPAALAIELFGRMLKGVDFLTSNVPGPPIPVFMAGARLVSQFPFGPLGGAAVNVTLLSYLDECNLGITSDSTAVSDPDLLRTCIEESFDDLRKAAVA